MVVLKPRNIRNLYNLNYVISSRILKDISLIFVVFYVNVNLVVLYTFFVMCNNARFDSLVIKNCIMPPDCGFKPLLHTSTYLPNVKSECNVYHKQLLNYCK